MNRLAAIFLSLFLVLTLPVFSLDYDYSSTRSIPIKIAITREISTATGNLYEGEKVEFRVLKNAYDGRKLVVSKGEIIQGTVETVITSGMNGFPAEIIIDDFDIPNVNQSQLESTYIKAGVNRCFWVYPLKWLMTPLYPMGSLTNFIMGGHAKIKTDDIITIYYYPDWK